MTLGNEVMSDKKKKNVWHNTETPCLRVAWRHRVSIGTLSPVAWRRRVSIETLSETLFFFFL